MKCQFVLDVDVDVRTMPQDEKSKIKYRRGRSHITKKVKMIAYYPAGTEYNHPDAYKFVNRGMAIPADDECEKASIPLSPERRAQLQLEYKATSLGIHDKEDRELFFAGVIAGYEVVNDQTAYLPGPNWAAYAEEKKAEDEKAETDV